MWNHKRIHRIYCLLKLSFRRKGKQRLPVRNPSPLATPEALNRTIIWPESQKMHGTKTGLFTLPSVSVILIHISAYIPINCS